MPTAMRVLLFILQKEKINTHTHKTNSYDMSLFPDVVPTGCVPDPFHCATGNTAPAAKTGDRDGHPEYKPQRSSGVMGDGRCLGWVGKQTKRGWLMEERSRGRMKEPWKDRG